MSLELREYQVRFIVHADIRMDGGEGVVSFTLYVTTPNFLARSIKTDRFQLGRGLLVVNEFDWEVVEEAVNSICQEVEADTWLEMASQLSRCFFYEYE